MEQRQSDWQSNEDEKKSYARRGRSAYDVLRTKKVAAAMDECRELDGIGSGMRVRGEYASGPKLYGAVPDRYEIWAATRLGGYDNDVTFLSTNRRRKRGNPDLLLGGHFVEIGTPVRASKVSERMHDGCLQCLNRGQQEGAVIISPLRLEDDQVSFNGCVDSVAERKRRRGDDFTLFVLGPTHR